MSLSAYALLAASPFALRMRNDLPVLALVVVLSLILGFAPLLTGRRYLGALLASAFVTSGIGGYWWTTIPWDELITDSGFPTAQRPGILDYALVASPAVVCAFYAVAARPSVLRADLLERGVDADEVRWVAATSFLSGASLLILCGGLSLALWWLMASGLAFAPLAPIPRGLPAIVIVGALVVAAYALLARRLPSLRLPRGAADARRARRRRREAAARP